MVVCFCGRLFFHKEIFLIKWISEGRRTLKRKAFWTIFFKIRAKIVEKKNVFSVFLRNEFYRLSVRDGFFKSMNYFQVRLFTNFPGVYLWAMTFAWYGSSSFKTFLNNVSRQKLHEKMLTFLWGGVGNCCVFVVVVLLSFFSEFSPLLASFLLISTVGRPLA